MERITLLSIISILLFATTNLGYSNATSALDLAQSCSAGQRRCVSARESPLYYLCNNNVWSLYTCGNGFTCVSDTPKSAICVPINPPQNVCSNGQRRCFGDRDPSSYYRCENSVWVLYTCGKSNKCVQTGEFSIDCRLVNQNHPGQCIEGEQRCTWPGHSGLYSYCAAGVWSQGNCGFNSICTQSSKTSINCAPAVEECVSGHQRCVSGPRSGKYEVCINGHWVGGACDSGSCIGIPGNLINCQVGDLRDNYNNPY